MIRDLSEFYERVNELAADWEKSELKNFGVKLRDATYGSTSGEILGEIDLVLKDFQKEMSGAGIYDIRVRTLLEFIGKAFRS